METKVSDVSEQPGTVGTYWFTILMNNLILVQKLILTNVKFKLMFYVLIICRKNLVQNFKIKRFYTTFYKLFENTE